ncbi:hypothetical protein [Kitasatospora sp. NPDC056531]|uniref:hypothetical protein n=1 Tax=Kitasatospora sp. NPDC056531 TaxID=3345856 RepID=UPI0036A8908D
MIGMWLSHAAKHRRPTTLFATYISVGAVADAYEYWAQREGGEGKALPPLGLMVCDEAHRSSGGVEKTWTVVHDQAAIPAQRRLYMTSTPRIWAPPKRPVTAREDAYQPLPEELAVSMDDQRVYGPHVYSLGLAEAIDRKLLAPFEIVVLELRGPLGDRQGAERQGVTWGPGVGEARDGSEDEVPAERIAAIQAGLVKTMVERGLQRCITFHNRTIEARYFSETLNQTVEKLRRQLQGGRDDRHRVVLLAPAVLVVVAGHRAPLAATTVGGQLRDGLLPACQGGGSGVGDHRGNKRVPGAGVAGVRGAVADLRVAAEENPAVAEMLAAVPASAARIEDLIHREPSSPVWHLLSSRPLGRMVARRFTPRRGRFR